MQHASPTEAFVCISWHGFKLTAEEVLLPDVSVGVLLAPIARSAVAIVVPMTRYISWFYICSMSFSASCKATSCPMPLRAQCPWQLRRHSHEPVLQRWAR